MPEKPDRADAAFDPASLYHENGAVDFDAVRAYLDDLTAKTPGQDEAPLGAAQSTTTFSVELGETPAMEDIIAWRNEDPAGFAVAMYMAHSFMQNTEQSHVRVSPTLEADPGASLVLSDEMVRFFDDMAEDQVAAYAFAQAAQEALGEPANNVHDLRAIVAIPAAGHQEHGTIFRTLEQYARQDMPTTAFEIVLNLNVPAEDGSQDERLASDLSLTLAEIARFREHYPAMQVRQIVSAYRGDLPDIGAIRADLWSTIAYDMLQRGRQEDIMVLSADADTAGLNTKYLSELAETFYSTGADMVVGTLLWQKIAGLPYDATANRILRYQSFLDIVRDLNSDDGTFHTPDAATGISLATYLAAGGFNRRRRLGEMIELAMHIRAKRRDQTTNQPAKQVEARARRALLRSDPRRLVQAMALGHSPYNAWDQSLIVFGPNDDLRTATVQAAAAEAVAQAHWQVWLPEMAKDYAGDVQPEKRERLLTTSQRILGFAALT